MKDLDAMYISIELCVGETFADDFRNLLSSTANEWDYDQEYDYAKMVLDLILMKIDTEALCKLIETYSVDLLKAVHKILTI